MAEIKTTTYYDELENESENESENNSENESENESENNSECESYDEREEEYYQTEQEERKTNEYNTEVYHDIVYYEDGHAKDINEIKFIGMTINNICCYINNNEININDLTKDYVCIYGKNCSGKSTLLLSLVYSIYGVNICPYKTKIENILSHNTYKLMSKLVFTYNRKKYTIEREYEENNSKIKMLCNKKTILNPYEIIGKIFGSLYRTLSTIFWTEYSEYDYFNLSDDKQIELLKEILCLNENNIIDKLTEMLKIINDFTKLYNFTTCIECDSKTPTKINFNIIGKHSSRKIPYKYNSFTEQTIINLGLRVALNVLSNKTINIMIIDNSYLVRLIANNAEILKTMRKYIKNCIILSMIDDIKSQTNTIYEIKKNEDMVLINIY